MSRAARLLSLVQTLRQYRTPVTAERLADKLGVSKRSVYRDIETLRAEGADIRGEAGVGFVLQPGFMLPPLMFTDDELEAMLLGLRLTENYGDAGLQRAAGVVRSKVRAVLPADLRVAIDEAVLLTGPPPVLPPERVQAAIIRSTIRSGLKAHVTYADASGRDSVRTIWPLALSFFERARVVIAHCELRGDFRCFRVDRMSTFEPTNDRYPGRRTALLREWQKCEGIPVDAD